MKCFRHTTYFRLQVVFLHDELFQANTTIYLVWVVYLRVELFLIPFWNANELFQAHHILHF